MECAPGLKDGKTKPNKNRPHSANHPAMMTEGSRTSRSGSTTPNRSLRRAGGRARFLLQFFEAVRPCGLA